MERILLPALLAWLLCCAQALASQSSFYDFTIVAKALDTVEGYTLTSFKDEVSINEAGTVAFIADLSPLVGQGVLRKKLGLPAELLTPGDVSSAKEFGSAWLDSADRVATTMLIAGTPRFDKVRL